MRTWSPYSVSICSSVGVDALAERALEVAELDDRELRVGACRVAGEPCVFTE